MTTPTTPAALDLAQFEGHTPWPWSTGHDGHGGMYIEAANGRQVGYLSSGPQQESNARLVTAAPSLLAECRALKAANAQLVEALQGLIDTRFDDLQPWVEAQAALAAHEAKS